jgi:hypothetical protein
VATSNPSAGAPDIDPGAAETAAARQPGIFEFTTEDLRANRRGYISQRQRAWLQGSARGVMRFSRGSATVALGFVLFGACLILALFLQNESTRAVLFAKPVNLLLLAGSMLAALTATLLSLYFTRRQTNALEGAGLQSVEGVVRLDQSYSEGSAITSYHVRVGDQKFSFTEEMGKVFKEGHGYRVYFCRSGPYQLILSLEELKAGGRRG